MEKQTYVFGIDLGTTYSCIAYVDDTGNPAIVKNMEGDIITPSVVFFESDSNVVVGLEAKNTAAMLPDQVVSFVKRSMGKPGFSFNYGGSNITPEEISAYILKKVVGDAEKVLGIEIKDVIISHPAYFGINEREATKKAGEIAGLNVISLIDEPVAAAITYGCTRGDENKVVLVYDLGGGTFDVTMIEITKEAINVICTGGDANLGGKNWDDAIITYVAQQFEEQTGVSADDLLDDMETLQDLMIKAEHNKIGLTQKDKVMVPVSYDGNKARIELTREKFDEITADKLARTISLTREMLAEAAEKGYTGYDELLLVGGSTRMPQVTEIIRKELGVEPQVFEPDEAVAKGAAIYGFTMLFENERLRRIRGILEQSMGAEVVENISDEEVRSKINTGEIDAETVTRAEKEVIEAGYVPKFGGRRTINPVTSKSFGVVAYDQNDNEKLFNLITKNTTVPCDVTETFGTQADNQNAVEIVIMENEYTDKVIDLEKGVEIGKASMEMPPALPSGSPIDVNFKLNKEGLLEMRAVERVEGRECIVVIQVVGGISEEQFQEAVSRGMKVTVS